MKCCICGQNLEGRPAMVDKVTGEAFCSRDSHYFGLDPSNRPHRAAIQEPENAVEPQATLLWETQLKDGGESMNRFGPVRFGDVLIVGLGKCLHSLSFHGSINWTYIPADRVGATTCPRMPVACNDLIVFVTRRGGVHAIDIKTGKQRWECMLGGDLQEYAPASDNKRIYIGDGDNNLYALDGSNGKVVWSNKQNDWFSSLLITNGYLYASGKKTIVSFDASTGENNWSTPIDQLIREPVAVAGNIVYGSTATKVVALAADRGTPLWDYRFTDDRPVQYCHASQPIVAGRKLFVRRNDHSVACVDLERHELDWRYVVPLEKEEYSIFEPVVGEGMVFCKLEDSYLHAIDAVSGAALWRRPLETRNRPVLDNGNLYLLEHRRLCAMSIK